MADDLDHRAVVRTTVESAVFYEEHSLQEQSMELGSHVSLYRYEDRK
jgi:hypothetical protein